MIADEKIGEGFPGIDVLQMKSWQQDASICLMGQNRAHRGLQARPTLDAGTATTLPARTLAFTNLKKEWLIAQDKAYSLIFKMCRSNPDALTIAYTYHSSKTGAVPPEDPLATELMEALKTRFLG
jgi:hypothetical protein